MSESVVEIINNNVSHNCEEDKLQKLEVENVDLSEGSTTPTHLRASIHLGIFGYKFKGPEMFPNQSRAELLNSEISHYIERRRSGNISSKSKRNSLGNTACLNEMSKFPIRFNNSYMEKLYSLNLNGWMIRRMPFISILILIVTLIFWPVSVITFTKTGLWNEHQYIITSFHAIMGLTCVLAFVPLVGFFTKLHNATENVCYITLGVINLVWGCWLILSSYNLRGHSMKSSIYEFVTATEALKALTYIYTILPIVAMDSFLPTRSSRTWWIHLQFIILYSIYTVVKGHISSSWLAWVYIGFRIFAYISIISLLYFGTYNTELQNRISFYNWLSTSRKIDSLEKAISEAKSPIKPFTPAENILVTMKRCIKIAKTTIDASGHMFPEISGSLHHMCNEMRSCLRHLTASQNLYSIPGSQIYKNLGEEADIVETYIASYSEGPSLTLSKSKSVRLVGTKKGTPALDASFSQYLGTVTTVEEAVNLFQLLNDWNFNILGHFKTNKQPFVSLAYPLLREFESCYNLPQSTVLNFLGVVERLYNNVAYHNSMHGIFVAQKMCCLANFIGIYDQMSPLDRAIFVVSGMCHDIGHPGKTNSFFVKSGHEVAHLFNDKAVLENFHSCLTFKVLKTEECNIFSFLSGDELRDVRRKIIDLILCTDMEDHFESISRFRLKRISQDFNTETELWNICKMLIKASDIGSTCVSWNLSYEWAQRLLCEFYSQGDLEKRLDLPVSALCDSNRHRDVPKAQSGFLRLVVSPLFEELSKIPYNTNKRKKYETLSDYDELSKSSKSFAHNFGELDEKWARRKPDSDPKAKGSDSFHYVELVTGNINSHYHRNISDIDFFAGTKHQALPHKAYSNRVYDVCLLQLRENIERWEQMADLGETLPIDDFIHEDVNLDIHLVI